MYKHYCVIDADGNYVEFVLTVDGTVYGYQLEDGETLLDAAPPENMVKPQWDGEQWVETGEAPEPEPEPTQSEKRRWGYENLRYMPVDNAWPVTELTDEPIAHWNDVDWTADELIPEWQHYASSEEETAHEIAAVRRAGKMKVRGLWPDEG